MNVMELDGNSYVFVMFLYIPERLLFQCLTVERDSYSLWVYTMTILT